MNSSKVLLGVLGGITAGAIAGILFAPAKGKKTRKKILNKGKLYDNVTDKYENLLQSKDDLITEAKTKLNAEKKEMKNHSL
jgi:gas vesicle protein